MPRVFGCEGRRQLAGEDVERLLHDLEADAALPGVQRVVNQPLGGCTLAVIGFVEEVDEDVGVDKISAHSFRLG